MKPITTGTENFKEFIDKGFYYVDKSHFIESSFLDKVILFTRPRRFGKTLNMSMLYYFYSNKEKDNAYLFDNLGISNNKDIMKHQNLYPTIFMTLKDMKNNNFSGQIYKFSSIIAKVLDKFEDMLDSEKLNNREKTLLDKYHNMNASVSELQESLYNISICLEKHYGKKVIILIDEYDVPLQSSYQYDYYDEMTNFMSSVFSSALKTNESLEKAILTGCLRIAKESIFTGLNNFSVYSIFNKGMTSSQFGFTQPEVDELLEYYNLIKYRNEMKEWYDGYLFGNTEIYNPWSVLKYIRQIKDEHDHLPQSYWANTSSNSIVYDYIQNSDEMMKEEFENLIQGNGIVKSIHPELTYREMDDIENIYSFLLFTGYLKVKKQLSLNEYELIIPNKEVYEIYNQTFIQYFRGYTKVRKRDFVEALKQGDTEKAEDILNQILRNSISYYDNYENFYHGFLVGLLQEYNVKSNHEAGEGRFDIVIRPRRIREKCIIIECKKSSSVKQMISDSEKAAKQIIERKYMEGMQDEGYLYCIGYGIAFFEKQCYMTKVGNKSIS